jgi:hypothetical protein
MKSFWLHGYSDRQARRSLDGHRWVAAERRRNWVDHWGYQDDTPEIVYRGSVDCLSSVSLESHSGSQLSPHISAKTKRLRSFVFVIDFSDPRAIEPAAFAGKCRHSIVVRIEVEDDLFAFSAAEPERATRTFAEVLAQQTALLAIEKDFPNGVEPCFSAKQIDHLPPEFDNRLADFCVNGNNAWLVPRYSWC